MIKDSSQNVPSKAMRFFFFFNFHLKPKPVVKHKKEDFATKKSLLKP